MKRADGLRKLLGVLSFTGALGLSLTLILWDGNGARANSADGEKAAPDAKTADAKANDAKPGEAKPAEGQAAERDPAGVGKSMEKFEESSFGKPAAAEEGERLNLPREKQLDDVKRARESVEKKQKELAAKEAELAARERALDEELKKLKELRDVIGKAEGDKKKENEERVAKVIETLETMSPKAAAPVLNGLEETLAVSAISKMSTAKLAKIMNLLDPAKASRLTELLAGVVRAKAATQSPVATNTTNARNPASVGGAKSVVPEKKGGEKQNDNHDSNQQPVSRPADQGR